MAKRDDVDMGEDVFFVLSSKTRRATVSGSLNVITLFSSPGLRKPLDEGFDPLEAAGTGVCSLSESSTPSLYSSNPARLLGVTMTL